MSPPANVAPSPELNLLPEWREPASPGRILRAGAGSILVHAALVILLVFLSGLPQAPNEVPAAPDLHKAVHLIAPRDFELTQKAPNRGKVTRELDVRSTLPAPQPQAPKFRPPAPLPGPIAQTPLIDSPRIDVPASTPPPPVAGPAIRVPPPPPPEKPKLAFENVAPAPTHTTPNPNSQIPLPKTSVQDATRAATTQSGGGGTTVGDIGDDLTTIPSLSQTPTPGRVGSNLQLLSDPKGVDFKPYLIMVLTAVRRNWMAVIPESARMGRRGQVLVQFIIDRQGGVPKLVIAEESGTEAFDRAAVAGISASNPFPPLPASFQGDQIRLQLAFSYNVSTDRRH